MDTVHFSLTTIGAIERQKGLDIRVVIGNPPWSAELRIRDYPSIDQRVKETYADTSVVPYSERRCTTHTSRLFRQASDRVLRNEKGGVVAFVTNGGFIDN